MQCYRGKSRIPSVKNETYNFESYSYSDNKNRNLDMSREFLIIGVNSTTAYTSVNSRYYNERYGSKCSKSSVIVMANLNY